MFRPLRADEIEVRVSTINEKGATLLLYKDARVDQNILDETVTPFGWQREHKEVKGNVYCGVGIKSADEWVWKWDAGAESYTEKVKGEASDSFKRACFNWGIGRELYSAPFIWVSSKDINMIEKNGKQTTYDKFLVEKIEYNDKQEIEKIAIKNSKTGKRVFLLI